MARKLCLVRRGSRRRGAVAQPCGVQGPMEPPLVIGSPWFPAAPFAFDPPSASHPKPTGSGTGASVARGRSGVRHPRPHRVGAILRAPPKGARPPGSGGARVAGGGRDGGEQDRQATTTAAAEERGLRTQDFRRPGFSHAGAVPPLVPSVASWVLVSSRVSGGPGTFGAKPVASERDKNQRARPRKTRRRERAQQPEAAQVECETVAVVGRGTPRAGGRKGGRSPWSARAGDARTRGRSRGNGLGGWMPVQREVRSRLRPCGPGWPGASGGRRPFRGRRCASSCGA